MIKKKEKKRKNLSPVYWQNIIASTSALRHMATHLKIMHVNICGRLGHTGERIVPIPNNYKWINEYSYQWDDSIHISRDRIKFNMPPYRQRKSHGGGEAILWPPHSHRRSPTTGRMASLTQKWRPSQKSGDSFGNHVQKSRKSAIQRTVRFICVKISNYICNIIHFNCSVTCFKHSLKLFLFQRGAFDNLHQCLL